MSTTIPQEPDGNWLQGQSQRVAHFYLSGEKMSLCTKWSSPKASAGVSGYCTICKHRLEQLNGIAAQQEPEQPANPRIADLFIGPAVDFVILVKLTNGEVRNVVLTPEQAHTIKAFLLHMQGGTLNVGSDVWPIEWRRGAS